MDPKFADRMNDLSEITDEVLDRRWDTLVEVVDAADQHQQARMVLIACGAALERDEDAWLWEPFREHEKRIPVDEGGELFRRLAECGARYMIDEKNLVLPAMCVRLAGLAGFSPFHQDLVDAAVDRLKERPSTFPPVTAPAAFWSATNAKAIEESPADPGVIGQQLNAMAGAAQKAMTALARQVGSLSAHAALVEHRLVQEQSLVQWLLNGVRSDGRSWSELDPSAVAVGAAAELSRYVIEAPQERHEATLAQVLQVADKDGDLASGVVDDLASTFAVPDGQWFAALVPLSVALAAKEPLPEMPVAVLATRVLWETATIRCWEA